MAFLQPEKACVKRKKEIQASVTRPDYRRNSPPCLEYSVPALVSFSVFKSFVNASSPLVVTCA